MINSVRNTVLAILNKANYGYLSPQDFNLYAKQAQMDEFEMLFSRYNNEVNKVNARLSGSGQADLSGMLQEDTEAFSVQSDLDHATDNQFNLPANLFKVTRLYTNTGKVMDKVSNDRVTWLLSNHHLAPSLEFPVYVQIGNTVTAYPEDLNTLGMVKALYTRYPKDPKWTWTTLSNGEPVFNQSQPDYQDFELSLDYEPRLIVKIVQYAGVEIREAEVVQYYQAKEQMDIQQEG